MSYKPRRRAKLQPVWLADLVARPSHWHSDRWLCGPWLLTAFHWGHERLMVAARAEDAPPTLRRVVPMQLVQNALAALLLAEPDASQSLRFEMVVRAVQEGQPVVPPNLERFLAAELLTDVRRHWLSPSEAVIQLLDWLPRLTPPVARALLEMG